MITIVAASVMGVLVYACVVGIIWALIADRFDESGDARLLVSLFWFVSLPALAGVWLGQRLRGKR